MGHFFRSVKIKSQWIHGGLVLRSVIFCYHDTQICCNKLWHSFMSNDHKTVLIKINTWIKTTKSWVISYDELLSIINNFHAVYWWSSVANGLFLVHEMHFCIVDRVSGKLSGYYLQGFPIVKQYLYVNIYYNIWNYYKLIMYCHC